MKAHTSSNGFASFLKNSFIGLLVAGTVAITSTLYAATPTTGDDWNIGADQTLQDGWGLITSTTPEAFTYDPMKKWNGIKGLFTTAVKPLLPSDQNLEYHFKYKEVGAEDVAYVDFDETTIDAGRYIVQISATAPNFALESTTVEIKVNPMKIENPIIALSSIKGEYNGLNYDVPTATVSTTEVDGKTIANTTVWTDLSDHKNAGNYFVTITADGNQNYTFDPKKVAFDITPKTITVAHDGTISAVYGSDLIDGVIFKALDGVEGETITFTKTNNYNKFDPVTKELKVIGALNINDDVNRNYTISGNGNVVTGEITKANATLAFTTPSVTFGSATKPEVSVVVTGIAGDADDLKLAVTVTSDYEQFKTGAGIYTVTASDLTGKGSENYQLPAVTTGKGNVVQANAIIAITTPDVVFGTATEMPDIKATASKLSGDTSGDEMTVTLTKGYEQFTSTVSTGYTATVTAIAGNANYKMPESNPTQHGTVTKAPLTLACTPVLTVYGEETVAAQEVNATGLQGENFTVAYTTDYTQFTSDVAIGFNVSVAQGAVLDPVNDNYEVAAKQTFKGTIKPKPLVIGYNSVSGGTTYGKLATIPTPVITGIVNKDDVTATVTLPDYNQASVVNDYVWIATGALGGTKAGNYTGSIDIGKGTYTLTVKPATLLTSVLAVALSKSTGVKLSTVSIPTTIVKVEDNYEIKGSWKWENENFEIISLPIDQNAVFTPDADKMNFNNSPLVVTFTINLSSDIKPIDKKIFVAETGSGDGSVASKPASIAVAIDYIGANADKVDGLNIVGDISAEINATELNVALVGMPQSPAKTVKIAAVITNKAVTGLVITGDATFAAGAILDKCTVVGATTGVAVAGSTVFFPIGEVGQSATITITEGKKIAKVDEAKKGIIDANILYLSSTNTDPFGPKFKDPSSVIGDFSLDEKSVLINRGKADPVK